MHAVVSFKLVTQRQIQVFNWLIRRKSVIHRSRLSICLPSTDWWPVPRSTTDHTHSVLEPVDQWRTAVHRRTARPVDAPIWRVTALIASGTWRYPLRTFADRQRGVRRGRICIYYVSSNTLGGLFIRQVFNCHPGPCTRIAVSPCWPVLSASTRVAGRVLNGYGSCILSPSFLFGARPL